MAIPPLFGDRRISALLEIVPGTAILFRLLLRLVRLLGLLMNGARLIFDFPIVIGVRPASTLKFCRFENTFILFRLRLGSAFFSFRKLGLIVALKGCLTPG